MNLLKIYQDFVGKYAVFENDEYQNLDIFFAEVLKTHIDESLVELSRNETFNPKPIDYFLLFFNNSKESMMEFISLFWSPTPFNIDKYLYTHFHGDKLFDNVDPLILKSLTKGDSIDCSTLSYSDFLLLMIKDFKILDEFDLSGTTKDMLYKIVETSKFDNDLGMTEKSKKDTFFRIYEILDTIIYEITYLFTKNENKNPFVDNTNKTKQSYELEKISMINNTRPNFSNIDKLSNKIIGQNTAIENLQNYLKCVDIGFYSEDKPYAKFLFTGPTGVGKTQTAKELAHLCFDDKIYIIDCTSLQLKSSLTGSAPGYVGYKEKTGFLEYVEQNPNCVLVFDEIDKIKQNNEEGVLDILMRMLDEGAMIDSLGHSVNLKGTVIICTSNYTANVTKTTGFLSENNDSKDEMVKNNGLKKELIVRFDEVVEFKQLEKSDMLVIAKMQMEKILQKFEQNNKLRNISIDCTDNFLLELIDKSNYRQYGFRDYVNIMNKITKKIAVQTFYNTKIRDCTLVINSSTDYKVVKKEIIKEVPIAKERTASTVNNEQTRKKINRDINEY